MVGNIPISGAKNAALPLLAAALLPTGASTYKNVPQLADVRTMAKLLRVLGWEVWGEHTELTIAPPTGKAQPKLEAPYDLVKTMRASVLVLGPLVARYGRARVSLPGGCAIGARPIDQHLKGLAAMGAKVTLDHGYVDVECKRLQGATRYDHSPGPRRKLACRLARIWSAISAQRGSTGRPRVSRISATRR